MKKYKRQLEYLQKHIPIPEENAAVSLTKMQAAALFFFMLLMVYGIVSYYLYGSYMFFYVVSALYLLVCTHKFILIIAGIFKKSEIALSRFELPAAGEWPLYTVLLPVYRETAIFPQLLKSIESLNYPKDSMEVLLLVEEDDCEFRKFLETQQPPPWWNVIIIPDVPPKTKGKALNYGLLKARGEYLVIYDAEDIPEKDQLRKAAFSFAGLPEDVVCLQSKLNYYNPCQNILTKWFTAEYSSWFDLYLPGIDAIKAPMPLGGTSNHFRTKFLMQINGWDPFNVTEDCDLGVRIFKAAYRTKVLDTTTWEEANSEIVNWIKQRSRWVKGYIQTYMVHMRNPVKLLCLMGPVHFFNFNMIIGGNVFVLCFNPAAWLLVLLWLLLPGTLVFPSIFFLHVSLLLFVGNFFFIGVNVLGVIRRRWFSLAGIALLSPVYWFFMSIGAWKGLFQYVKKPHFWEKTEHALFFNNSRNRTS